MNWKHKDKKYVWHPFTQMKEYNESDPVIVERGEGVKLIDTEGREYYDGVSSIWLNVHGHQVDEIDEAIRDQLDQVAHSTLLGKGSVPAVEFAEQLVEVSPDQLKKVFYSDSGATAVEIAMKMAIQYWANRRGEPTSKQKFLSFKNGYHGDTFGPMSVVPDPKFHWPFENMLPDPIQVEFPHPDNFTDIDSPTEALNTCLERVDSTIHEHEDELAALIVEPVQGAGGMITAPSGFLSELRILCDQYDILMIVDEVATGFGRTGAMFACDKADISPDLMPLGKGITGGYLPVAATLTTDTIYDEFLGAHESKKALYHGHSYTGNALGCAAGIASLELLRDLLPELPEKINYIREKLSPIEELGNVKEVRQEGFMCGIELMKNPDQNEPFPEKIRVGNLVCEEACNRGMLLRPLGDVVVFMPPQASSKSELKAMTNILKNSIEEGINQARTKLEKRKLLDDE